MGQLTAADWIAIGYLIFGIILYVASTLITILFLSWLIYAGVKYKSQGKCFFHHFSRSLKAIAGPYWYYECPVCGKRDTYKMGKSESPVNNHWLNGGEWYSPDNPRTGPPQEIRFHPFLSRPMEIKIYKDWPRSSPQPPL